MKPLIPIKYMLPLGLFILASSIIIKVIYKSEPDAIDGLLKGFSIGVLILYLIQSLYKRKETISDKSC